MPLCDTASALLFRKALSAFSLACDACSCPAPQVKSEAGLLECFQSYLEASGADLLVLGSHRLTAKNVHLVIGSIALAAIKRLEVRKTSSAD